VRAGIARRRDVLLLTTAQAYRSPNLPLLLVALDSLRIAEARRVRITAGLAERATLAKQVPALIEPNSERLEPPMLGFAQPSTDAPSYSSCSSATNCSIRLWICSYGWNEKVPH
jgi:hypothetical protein